MRRGDLSVVVGHELFDGCCELIPSVCGCEQHVAIGMALSVDLVQPFPFGALAS